MVSATGGGSGSKMKQSGSMRHIVDAAYGGLLAYGTIYDGLEKSSKVLGNSLKNESVQVVEHQVTTYILLVHQFNNNHKCLAYLLI